MLADVRRRAPEEACGLIAGIETKGLEVISITNALHSLVQYRMDPQEQLDAFNHIDQQGWELLAIYHSHPAGPAVPSATDVAEAAYPGVIHVIWFQSGGEWRCRGFLIEEEAVTEVTIHVAE